MNKVCIIGSMNMDLVVKVKSMPQEGETILSQDFEKIPGGKGANQAVAAQRSGAEVYMVSKIGRDENGEVLKSALKSDNINVDYISIDKKYPTGMAMIMVNENGNNSIIVVSGSNMQLNTEDLNSAENAIKNSDIVVSQFETPQYITLEAFKKAKEFNKVTILNPAPANKIDEEILKYTDIIIPNETEAKTLTNIKVCDLETAKKSAEVFLSKGVKFVVITLGEKGAAVISKDKFQIVPAFKVDAIDTTAAGDSFIGGVVAVLDTKNFEYKDIINSVIFGNKVSSIAVQRKGAQPSIPYVKEVKEVYGEE